MAGIDSANYQMIQSGMSLEEAEKLLTLEASLDISAEGYEKYQRQQFSKWFPDRPDVVEEQVKNSMENFEKNQEDATTMYAGVTKNVTNLSDGRKVVTFKSDGKSTGSTINLFVDSSGKVVAKDISLTSKNSDNETRNTFQDTEVFDDDTFKKTFPEYEVQQVANPASGHTSMFAFYGEMAETGSLTAKTGNQQGIRLKPSGPVGGEVASGDDAEDEFIGAVVEEAAALGDAENPLSPII